MPRRLILITGASAGIGAAFARRYAREGWDLALTARRLDRLDALAAELRGLGAEVQTIAADLADPAAPGVILAALGRPVDGLVNNAGYGLPGGFRAQSWPDHAGFIQVLMTAPTELAYGLLPGMVDRGFGRIVNVASVAGLMPGREGLYAAVKAYLLRFSQSLHAEVRGTGVHVTALCPGLTYSEFHEVAGLKEAYEKAAPRWLWQDAEAVVDRAVLAVEANRLTCVTGGPNQLIAVLARLLPDEWMLGVRAGKASDRRAPPPPG